MNIDTPELQDIIDMVAGARMQPLVDRIEAQEQTIKDLQERLAQTTKTIAMQALAIEAERAQSEALRTEVARLRTEQTKQTLGAMIYSQYIPLSKPATQEYVMRLKDDTRSLTFLCHFITHSLPKDAPRQLEDEVKQMTQLPARTAGQPQSVTNNFAAGSSAQVFNGEVNDPTFNK